MVIDFAGYKKYLKTNLLILLLIIPISTLIMNYTNDFHHIFYKKMYMNYQGLFPIVEIIPGPWYWVQVIHEYFLMVAGLVIFIVAYLNAVAVIRKQILILILAWIIPWISDIIYMLKLLPFDIDLCPIAFSFSAIIYSFCILRFKFLSLTPIVLEKVFSNMLDGIIILDSENNIVNFNNSAENIIPNLKVIKLEDQKIYEVLEDHEAVAEIINSNEQKENLISIKNNGQLRYYKVNNNNIYKKNNSIIGKILIFNDVTESKEQQEKLSKLNNFKDKLFTVVSHDIRSPLAVLLSLLELLDYEDGLDEDESKEILYEIKKNVKSTYEMVENILKWFKTQIDVGVSNITCNLLEVVKESIMPLMQNAELKGIDVSYEIPKDISVYVDRCMLEIILRNLFSNAIKFTNMGGSIKILAQEFSGIVTIAVSDTGIGIEKERIDELFNNAHFPTTFGTSGEKGTGIGLMICKEFIERNNGRIWALSSVGKGSTFYFTVSSDNTYVD